MGSLKYTKSLVFPKVNQIPTAELVNRLKRVFAVKRIGGVRSTTNGLDFDNLYLKRLDLLPVPKGWIQVREDNEDVKVTFGVDYRWRVNRRGRQMAFAAGVVMVLVTLYKFYRHDDSAGLFLLPWVLFLIPINVYLLWLFVFGLNSLYSRLYISKLIDRIFSKA